MRNEVTINNFILNFSCAPNWTGADDYAQFYNIILMIFGFFFPTMILLITNVAVLRTSNKVSRMCFNHTRANIFLLVYIDTINDMNFIATLFSARKMASNK